MWTSAKIPVFPPTARSASPMPPLSPAPLLPGPIQAKLEVGAVDDPLEHEADRVADHVMRMSEPQLQHACPCGGGCPKCQTEELGQKHQSLQTKHLPDQATPDKTQRRPSSTKF